MRLLPRGPGPDLLWLRGRLDAASTFIGQIKLKLFPITPAPGAPRFCTFILIDEAILVINGSYYTRLDRTFSFYRGPVWASEVYFDIGLDQSLISLLPSPASLTLFTFRGNLNLLWSVVLPHLIFYHFVEAPWCNIYINWHLRTPPQSKLTWALF